MTQPHNSANDTEWFVIVMQTLARANHIRKSRRRKSHMTLYRLILINRINNNNVTSTFHNSLQSEFEIFRVMPNKSHYKHLKSAYKLTRSSMPRQVGLYAAVWHSASVGQYSIQVLSLGTYWYLRRAKGKTHWVFMWPGFVHRPRLGDTNVSPATTKSPSALYFSLWCVVKMIK